MLICVGIVLNLVQFNDPRSPKLDERMDMITPPKRNELSDLLEFLKNCDGNNKNANTKRKPSFKSENTKNACMNVFKRTVFKLLVST